MSKWLIDEIIDSVEDSINHKVFTFAPLRLLQFPESVLVDALKVSEKSPENAELKTKMIEFLINTRRKHFAYVETGELWDFIQVHLNNNFDNLSQLPGPFGMFIETEGIPPALPYSVVPISRTDVEENINPYSKLFSKFISSAENHFMNVVYNSSTDSREFNFNFCFPISQFYISTPDREAFNACMKLVETFFQLRAKIQTGLNEHEKSIKATTLRVIFESPLDWFIHSFHTITEKHHSRFDFDSFEFIKNCKMLHSFHLKNKAGLIEETTNHDSVFRLMLIDFTSTRLGRSPEMRWMSENDILHLMAQEPKNNIWPAILEFNSSIKSGEIGFWYSDSEYTKKHEFQFSYQLII